MTPEYLAEELHKTYRAALKAFAGRAHDHGFGHCNKRKYFLDRAIAILEEQQRLQKFTARQAEINDKLDIILGEMYSSGAGVSPMGECPSRKNHCEEDGWEYSCLQQRLTCGSNVWKENFYEAQHQTLKVLGLAAMRGSKTHAS